MPAIKTPRLLAEERRRKILELVSEHGQVTIDDLRRRFDISAVTARGDLDSLSHDGAVIRSHGGAVRRQEIAQDFPLRLKATLHRGEKARIANAAVELIQPNETVILDSGTTTAEIAKRIKATKLHPITVITNALNIGTELADAPGVTLIMIGGLLRPISYSFVGPQAENMLREMHADRLFMGVDALDAEFGPSTPDIFEAQLNGVMMRVSKEVNIVADASKLGRRSVSRIGPIETVHRLITDGHASADQLAKLRAKGIEIITA